MSTTIKNVKKSKPILATNQEKSIKKTNKTPKQGIEQEKSIPNFSSEFELPPIFKEKLKTPEDFNLPQNDEQKKTLSLTLKKFKSKGESSSECLTNRWKNFYLSITATRKYLDYTKVYCIEAKEAIDRYILQHLREEDFDNDSEDLETLREIKNQIRITFKDIPTVETEMPKNVEKNDLHKNSVKGKIGEEEKEEEDKNQKEKQYSGQKNKKMKKSGKNTTNAKNTKKRKIEETNSTADKNDNDSGSKIEIDDCEDDKNDRISTKKMIFNATEDDYELKKPSSGHRVGNSGGSVGGNVSSATNRRRKVNANKLNNVVKMTKDLKERIRIFQKTYKKLNTIVVACHSNWECLSTDTKNFQNMLLKEGLQQTVCDPNFDTNTTLVTNPHQMQFIEKTEDAKKRKKRKKPIPQAPSEMQESGDHPTPQEYDMSNGFNTKNSKTIEEEEEEDEMIVTDEPPLKKAKSVTNNKNSNDNNAIDGTIEIEKQLHTTQSSYTPKSGVGPIPNEISYTSGPKLRSASTKKKDK